MAGTAAMLTRKEAAAMAKKVDISPSSARGKGDSGNPQCHVPNSTRKVQDSAHSD